MLFQDTLDTLTILQMKGCDTSTLYIRFAKAKINSQYRTDLLVYAHLLFFSLKGNLQDICSFIRGSVINWGKKDFDAMVILILFCKQQRALK